MSNSIHKPELIIIANAEPLFRLSEGALIKQYKSDLPLWAQALLP